MVTCSIPGGKAPVRDATEEVKEIALAVKAEVEAKHLLSMKLLNIVCRW